MVFLSRVWCAVLLAAATLPALAGVACAETPQPFPDFTLSGELTDAERDYLGVGPGSFNLSEVDAQFILVEVFSMYCPVCQREADELNQLHRMIEERGLASRLKMIGVGTGNTPYEVQFFKEHFKVVFPLLPDEKFAVNKGLGEVGTPHFALIRVDGPGELTGLFMHEGEVGEPAAFLDTLLEVSGAGEGGQ